MSSETHAAAAGPRRWRRSRPGSASTTTWVATVVVLAFLLLPSLVVLAYSFFPSAYIQIPPEGLTTRWYGSALEQRSLFLEPLLTSLQLAAQATAISAVLGTLAGLGLRVLRRWMVIIVRPVYMAPLFVPTLVTGIALMLVLTSAGYLGSYGGLLAGHVVITFPYVFVTMAAGVASLDTSVEEASATLGAKPLTTLVQVTLPALLPSLLGGAIFAFIISFDQLELTLLLSSPTTVPLPVQLFSYVQQKADPTVAAVSSMLIVINLVLLAALQRLGGLNRRVL